MIGTNYNSISIEAARIIVAEANRLTDRKVIVSEEPLPESNNNPHYNPANAKRSGFYSIRCFYRDDLSEFWREFDRLEKAYLKDMSLPR